MTEDVLTLDIDERTGWPDELCVLLKDHPRDTWSDRRSPLAQFWLDKHDYFRGQAQGMSRANDDFRQQRGTPAQFGTWVAPRLQSFISHLHGHHQIEDFHYFPAWRAADPRLARGFDVLESDHKLLHEGIMALVESINEFILTFKDAPDKITDAQRHAGDKYVEVSELAFRRLVRHLADEEDLIIPLMFERGE